MDPSGPLGRRHSPRGWFNRQWSRLVSALRAKHVAGHRWRFVIGAWRGTWQQIAQQWALGRKAWESPGDEQSGSASEVAVTALVDPGIPLIWDNATAKLDESVQDLRGLDTKAATMVVLLGGAVAAYGVVVRPFTSRIIVGGLLGIATLATLLAFWIRASQSAPTPDVFASYAGYEPDVLKAAFLDFVLLAWRRNQRLVLQKGCLLNIALGAIALLAAVVIVSAVAGVKILG